MEMQNRSKFDQEWEKAFADAEMDVSPGVWEKVELGVMSESNGKYKKRLLLFQLLAAASVAFALSVGGVGIYQLYNGERSNNKQQLSENKNADSANTKDEKIIQQHQKMSAADPKKRESKPTENTKAPIRTEDNTADQDGFLALSEAPDKKEEERNKKLKESAGSAASASVNDQQNVAGDKQVTKDGTAANKNPATGPVGKKAGNVKKDFIPASDGSENEKASEDDISDKNSLEGVTSNKIVLDAEPNEVARIFEYLETKPIAEMELRMVPWYSYIPEKRASKNGIWAGIGFSAGSFNPNATAGNAPAQMETLSFDAKSNRTPSFTQEKAGQSVNMGINIGARLSDKWVLQSGLVYIQQQTSSTSNVVSTNSGASARALSSYSDVSATEDIAFTAPYDINNTYELISVPLQAGYILLDKKFSIILLSGVANNILIKNQIGSLSGDFEDAEISSGSDSRYRTYQLSGMFGSEFSYDLGSNYSLSIVPQIRQAINSITKSEVDYSSRPTTLEIGFRLKYIFGR